MRASTAPTSFKKNRTNRRENDGLDPDGAAWSFIAFPQREQWSQRSIARIVLAFQVIRRDFQGAARLIFKGAGLESNPSRNNSIDSPVGLDLRLM
jgi:hypothetical protein